jgi:uncharacterized cupin superfamily protein
MAGFGAKVFKPNEISEINSSGMPEEFREAQKKRFNRRLADYAGLKNFGVNLIVADKQSDPVHVSACRLVLAMVTLS